MQNFSCTRSLQGLELKVCGLGLGPHGLVLKSCRLELKILGLGLGRIDYITASMCHKDFFISLLCNEIKPTNFS